jgi:hypothetical protein
MQKFLVVSYDDDQQQWFWDFVAAPNSKTALEMVCTDRPYIIDADAVSCDDLCALTRHLEAASVANIAKDYKRTIKEV